jgi:hypothetical protein
MKTAPIALFVYNRPEHTKVSIDALSKNVLASESDLFIFSDGAKNNGDWEAVLKVRDICRNTKGFKSISIFENKTNKGLASNIIDGITKIFTTNDSVICLEDDLVTTEGFVEYMNNALDFYKDKDIFSISGYSPPIEIPASYGFSTYCAMRNCSWGWATWRTKWNAVDWKVSDFKQFISNKTLCKSFETAGNDTVIMLLKQQMGLISSWSIRFNYAAFQAGEPTIYPVRSLISNAGIDGSGTNMRKSSKFDSATTESIDYARFKQTAEMDKIISARFRKFYNTSLIRRLINKVKLVYYREIILK